MNKQISYIAISIISPIMIVATLFLISKRPNEHLNGFKRKRGFYSVVKVAELRNVGGFTRTVGFGDSQIYFNQAKPFGFYSTNFHLDRLMFRQGEYDSMQLITASFTPFLHYPNIFIAAGNLREVIQQNLTSGARHIYHLPARFTRSCLISENSIIVRSFDTSRANRVFEKINLTNGNVQAMRQITERFNDGGFVTDGQLTYDEVSGRLYYVYYYSNQFVCMDSNLNIIYHGHTIDTVKTRRFPIAADIRHQSFTPAVPLNFVNRTAFAYANKLYVISALKADNDESRASDTTDPVDIYDAQNGHYLSSIYLPRLQNSRIKSIAVHNDKLIAVFANGIMAYKLVVANL